MDRNFFRRLLDRLALRLGYLRLPGPGLTLVAWHVPSIRGHAWFYAPSAGCHAAPPPAPSGFPLANAPEDGTVYQ